MLSYHSDPTVKARYLARVEGHAAADEIIKGRCWEAGKGCAVGCTVHGGSHEDFERELGIPQMLAWLEDVIFEGLPNRLAKTWPQRFLSSIEPGSDLKHVPWALLHWLLTDNSRGESGYPIVEEAVSRCAGILVPLIDGRSIDRDAAEQAASLAWAAAESAEVAACVSTRALWIVESAARAAESAALSTTSSASSAECAAIAVTAAIAQSADYVTVSEKLLELLRAVRGTGPRRLGTATQPKHSFAR